MHHEVASENQAFLGSSERHSRKNGDMGPRISENFLTLSGSVPKKFGMIPAGIGWGPLSSP